MYAQGLFARAPSMRGQNLSALKLHKTYRSSLRGESKNVKNLDIFDHRTDILQKFVEMNEIFMKIKRGNEIFLNELSSVPFCLVH